MNNNTSSSSPILFSDGGGVLNSGKIKIEGTSGKNYNLDNFTTVTSCPFPVGFGGFFQIDPNSIYAGTTWEQKKDVFILAAGDKYPAGSTGGEAQHKLTTNEMPNHDHVERANNSYSDPNDLSDLIDTSNSGNNPGFTFDLNKFVKWANAVNSKTGVTAAKGIDYSEKGVKIPTSTSGGSQPHNNMPPYLAMPFWVRTA